MVEDSKNNGKDFYILTFTIEDYEQLLKGKTFFDIVKAKKLEMKLASDHMAFIKDNRHEAEAEIENIVKECI